MSTLTGSGLSLLFRRLANAFSCDLSSSCRRVASLHQKLPHINCKSRSFQRPQKLPGPLGGVQEASKKEDWERGKETRSWSISRPRRSTVKKRVSAQLHPRNNSAASRLLPSWIRRRPAPGSFPRDSCIPDPKNSTKEHSYLETAMPVSGFLLARRSRVESTISTCALAVRWKPGKSFPVQSRAFLGSHPDAELAHCTSQIVPSKESCREPYRTTLGRLPVPNRFHRTVIYNCGMALPPSVS